MKKAKFTPVKGLDQLVAKMIVPEVQKVINTTKREAQHRAPATKKWVTMRDDAVRDTHRAVHDKEIPENLRFELQAFLYDMKHPFDWIEEKGRTGPATLRQAPLMPGAFSYMQHPRDRSPGHPVQIVNCRCRLVVDENGMAKMIHMRRAKARGTKVRGQVYAEGPYVIEAEYGDEYAGYPIPFHAEGTYFMRATVATMAARGKTSGRMM